MAGTRQPRLVTSPITPVTSSRPGRSSATCFVCWNRAKNLMISRACSIHLLTDEYPPSDISYELCHKKICFIACENDKRCRLSTEEDLFDLQLVF